MNLFRLPPGLQDKMLLKWPIFFLLLALLACGTLCTGALNYRAQSQQALEKARSLRQNKQATVRQLEEEARTITEFSSPYRELEINGVISEEDRLALMETVAAIRSQQLLYPVQIDIDQQTALPLGQAGNPSPGTEAGLELRASRIRVDMALLHEEDLSRMLNGLQALRRGFFITESCSLKRVENTTDEIRSKGEKNLSAQYTLLWITMKQVDQVSDRENEPPPP